MNNFQAELCQKWTRKDNLKCLPEDLEVIEKLEFSEESEGKYEVEIFLKACQICGQVYREKVYTYKNGGKTNLFYKIPGNLVNQCHCIGYLNPIEILFDNKICEDDPMYFAQEKETRMQCGKCGNYYKEIIYQNNFDAVYYQTYEADNYKQ